MDADTLARRLRPLFFILAVPALPVFLLSYFYMIRLAYESLPLWAFLGLGAAHTIVWIAASMLHDFQKERQSSQWSGPQTRPPAR